MARKDTPDDFVVQVRRGKLKLVHKQIIRWRKKRKAALAELKKLHKETEVVPEPRPRDFFGSDNE